jgi:8-oxo-dGTP diphosphatase
MENGEPKVGVGVFIFKEGKFILGKRLGSHGAGEWSLPGGHLEYFEDFETCCKRETMEETGLTIKNVRPLSFVNDLFPKECLHYVTLFFTAEYESGELENKEPNKCEGWEWHDENTLPYPAFKSMREMVSHLKILGYLS